jgi:hypothetical protein
MLYSFFLYLPTAHINSVWLIKQVGCCICIHSSSFTFPSRLLHLFVSNGFTNSNSVLAFAIDPDTEFTAQNALADCCFCFCLIRWHKNHITLSHHFIDQIPCSGVARVEGRVQSITHRPSEQYSWDYRHGESDSSKNGSLSHHAS